MFGFFLGRRSVNGVILSTRQAPGTSETAALRSIPTSSAQSSDKSTERVELNRATLEELMELPGIGETRARQILEYREENGPFRQASDLMKVNGIGEGIFAGLRDLVYVEESHENPDH